MSENTQTDNSPFVMVHLSEDGKDFIERPLTGTNREDCAAEFMALIRVLKIERGYVMQRDEQVIFKTFP